MRCLYESADAYDLTIAWDRGGNAATDEILYFSWWVRASTLGANFPTELDDDGGTTDPGGDPVNWQWKLARWRYNANDVQDAFANGDSYIAHWDNSDGSFIDTSDGFHYINGSASPFVNNVSGRRAGGDDLPTAYGQEWYRCEWYWFMGDTGTGRTFFYVTREGSTRNLCASLTGRSFFAGGETYRHMYLQNYLGNGPAADSFDGTYLSMDDIHVQYGNTRRVEYVDNLTLSSATFREIQDWTSWSGTSVQGTLNTGAGRTGAGYLAVVETDVTTRNDTVLGSLAITVS